MLFAPAFTMLANDEDVLCVCGIAVYGIAAVETATRAAIPASDAREARR
jgi:hypothetical protein